LSLDQLIQLHKAAREIFNAGLRAVDAREVTQTAVASLASKIDRTTPIYALCIGKAALPMAVALEETLGSQIKQGILTSTDQSLQLQPNKWQRFAGGHPLPTEESLAAAKAAFQIVEKANAERGVVIFAVSGGGSAMIEWPANPDIDLGDLQLANGVLVSCGATISEINSVRRAFSAVKGGKLASRATNAQLVTLIISDTNPGDEASVASGPSLLPNSGSPSAREIVKKYQLDDQLPVSIFRAIQQPSEPITRSGTSPSYLVLADNRTAIDAASAKAHALGFRPMVCKEISEQPIAEGCEQLLERVSSEETPVCLISGGEFSCPVRGEGRGGRNLETALRCAIQLNLSTASQHIVVLSAGTDGVDGNSPAAGAFADEATLTRARALGLVAADFLARSDSYSFFEKLGDAIVTGPTGTNVRDLRIVLKADSL
jgi:glycerate 2-kinase